MQVRFATIASDELAEARAWLNRQPDHWIDRLRTEPG